MRILTSKAAQLCGCTKEMQPKITAEALRIYDVELEDHSSVYQFLTGKGLLERFQSFVWLLIRFNGTSSMVYSIVYKMAMVQYLSYGDKESFALAEGKFKENYSQLSAAKRKSFDAVIKEEEETKGDGWRG